MSCTWPLDSCLRCACTEPACVTAFSKWLFAGFYTTGTWADPVWTPSGPLDNTATPVTGDSTDPVDPTGGKFISIAADLGAFSAQFVSPGIWLPEGDFAFLLNAVGEACASVPALHQISVESSIGVSFDLGGKGVLLVYTHPLDAAQTPGTLTLVRVWATLDGGPAHWGPDFTFYFGEDPTA